MYVLSTVSTTEKGLLDWYMEWMVSVGVVYLNGIVDFILKRGKSGVGI